MVNTYSEIMRKVFAFIKRDFLIETSYRFAFFLNIFSIFFMILTFFFIARLFGEGASKYLTQYGGEYFPFVLIGLAFSTYLSMGLSGLSGSLRREQMMGTLEAVLLTPTRISTIIFSLSLFNFLVASVDIIIYLVLGIFLGISINLAHFFPVVVILILTIISFSSLGIMSAGFIIIFKRGDPINWLFSTVSFLLGGVYYPVSILPTTLQKLARLLPITHSLEGIRIALLTDSPLSSLLPSIFALFIFSAVLLPSSILLFRYAIKKAKVDGSLVQY